ncbi:MAG: outer membrane lipoprotein-sorting protein [Proteobacteria bacterium]|nr:outer membrane lipoprotein-sorting protein [Pseudomonadota bacterium]
MRTRRVAATLILTTSLALGGGTAASAQAEADAAVEMGHDSAPEATSDADLDGDIIYQRILANRFNSYDQSLEMESGNQSRAIQSTSVRLRYLSFRADSDRILSKTIAKYHAPQDVRHLGYLIINKVEGVDDQFVYRPSSRRVRRVNLRGESVFGTDFSFEDIIPQEFEDGIYQRMPDEKVGDVDCFVIQVTPTKKAESEYSKMVVYAHKENYVPVRTLYWDNKNLMAKEMKADPDSIQRFEDEENGQPKIVWFAKQMRMDHLQLETWTNLVVTELQPNPGLRNRDFSERELARSH